MSSTEQTQSKPESLGGFWRFVLLVVAALLLFAAYQAWYNPPTKVEFAPQATTASGATDKVEVRSETSTVLLIGLAVLCIVIAANGRKLTSVKIGGQEISTDVAKAADEAGKRAKEMALDRSKDPAKAEQAAKIAQAEVYSKVASVGVGDIRPDEVAKSVVEELLPR